MKDLVDRRNLTGEAPAVFLGGGPLAHLRAQLDLPLEQLNEEDQEDALRGIREFLSSCSAPDGISPEVWALVEDLTREENSAALLEIVQSFEWGFGSADYPEIESGIKQALLQTGLAENEEIAQALFERLQARPGRPQFGRSRAASLAGEELHGCILL